MEKLENLRGTSETILKERSSKDFSFKEKLKFSPKTDLGRRVKNGEFESIQAFLRSESAPIEPGIVDYLQPNLRTEVVSTARISHTLKAGKVYQFRVVCLVGNGRGVIGCGVGKSKVKVKAVRKAVLRAKKNILYLKGLEKTTTSYTPKTITFSKNGATKIEVAPLIGSSVTASKLGKLYCELAGVVGCKISTGTKKKDRKGKVNSSLNYYTSLQEAFQAQVQKVGSN